VQERRIGLCVNTSMQRNVQQRDASREDTRRILVGAVCMVADTAGDIDRTCTTCHLLRVTHAAALHAVHAIAEKNTPGGGGGVATSTRLRGHARPRAHARSSFSS
jgi:hypothetical protein